MRHGDAMGTKLTFQGVDSVVELEDHAVTLHGAKSTVRSDADAPVADENPTNGDPVVIPRWEVQDVTLKPPTLLGYGKLTIATQAGREHTVEFSRDAQDRFENLAAILG
jgi:hypothetical protein